MTKKNLVVLSSGGGTNLQALIDACQSEYLKASVTGLVTNKPDSPAIARAKKASVTTVVVSPKDFDSISDWDKQLTKVVKELNPDIIILAGFVLKIGSLFLKTFENKIINTHPSLLPKYGGQGMFGHHVHKAVLKSKDTCTGISIHWVNQNYDAGKLIDQIQIPISPNETLKSLIEKIKPIEHEFLIKTVKLILKQ